MASISLNVKISFRKPKTLAYDRAMFYARRHSRIRRNPVTEARIAISNGLYRNIQCAFNSWAQIEGNYSHSELVRMREFYEAMKEKRDKMEAEFGDLLKQDKEP